MHDQWVVTKGLASVSQVSDWGALVHHFSVYIHNDMHIDVQLSKLIVLFFNVFTIVTQREVCQTHIHTHTQDETLSSPQGCSLPKCSVADKLSLKWTSSPNRPRQSLGKWPCNQQLLTPYPSPPHTLPMITTVIQQTCFTITKEALLRGKKHH